jgi:hypothetical protein
MDNHNQYEVIWGLSGYSHGYFHNTSGSDPMQIEEPEFPTPEAREEYYCGFHSGAWDALEDRGFDPTWKPFPQGGNND